MRRLEGRPTGPSSGSQGCGQKSPPVAEAQASGREGEMHLTCSQAAQSCQPGKAPASGVTSGSWVFSWALGALKPPGPTCQGGATRRVSQVRVTNHCVGLHLAAALSSGGVGRQRPARGPAAEPAVGGRGFLLLLHLPAVRNPTCFPVRKRERPWWSWLSPLPPTRGQARPGPEPFCLTRRMLVLPA